MTADTPLDDRRVAPPTDTDDLESDETSQTDDCTPSLEDLDDDELIRCYNPNYEFLTWFYELDSDGTVLTYHQLDEFEQSAGTDRTDAESSIACDQVTATIVDRDVLEDRRGGV